MNVIKAVDLHTRFREICFDVEQGEKVLIARPHNKNMVLITEKVFNNLVKELNNYKYIEKLNKSFQEAENGEYTSYDFDELRAMEN